MIEALHCFRISGQRPLIKPSYECATSCDHDKHPQFVLSNLPKDRPVTLTGLNLNQNVVMPMLYIAAIVYVRAAVLYCCTAVPY